ncbi:MAG TPA: aminomethyl-transferring glycine dehydrogenase subunit GcvPA [Bacillales bacterium]|nr:aminomethyl-transferring glycine dehydrogenase subunit GcvPA [Bacillales bacterium]
MNKFRYLPMTEQDKKEMLDTVGVSSTEELFSDIPEKVRFKGSLDIEPALPEPELMSLMSEMADRNANTKQNASFLGAGVYDHYIPSIVDHVISRSEFYTAYTPYQAEMSQGELQAIFEFQTMICELTGMDVANSSMYDGATALAEAAILSVGTTRKKKIIVSQAVHPQARSVLHTYAKGQNLEVIEIPVEEGVTDLEKLKAEVDDNTASVIVQYPNFYGQIERLKELEEVTHSAKKAMFIVSSNPLALGLLTPPGAFGADVVVGDAQPFGIPESFGGPHCGYFATRKKHTRRVPGRLVGQTTDQNGERGFVMTLQTREQHIRRDKATSNICSNQALNALASSVAMAALGKHGMKEIAYQNAQKAAYARKALEKQGIHPLYEGPFFNEFVIELAKPVKEVNRKLLEAGIIGGYNLGRDDKERDHQMLVAVTELRTKKEIDIFAEKVGGLQ